MGLGVLSALKRPIEPGEDRLAEHLEHVAGLGRGAMPARQREVQADEEPHGPSVVGPAAATKAPG